MPLDTAFAAGPAIPPNVTPITFGGRRVGAGPIVLEAVPNPFSNEIVTIRGPEGSTIGELLDVAGIRWRRYRGGVCWIEDADRRLDPEPVPRRLWHRVRPKAGTVTTVKLLPGGGQGGGKQILTILLSIAVLAASVFLGPEIALLAGFTKGTALFAAASAAITAAISIVGNLIISALIPPPSPRTDAERAGGFNDRQGFTIQSTGNRARPYQKIPLHLGRLRRWPDLYAEHVTEPRGNDVYYRFLLCVGWGPLHMEDWKLGETPVAELEGFRMNVREGWPDDAPPEIYTNDFHTDGLSIELRYATGAQERVTVAGTDEIQIEIAFPEGLGGVDITNGNLVPVTVEFGVRIAPFGTEDWSTPAWANAAEPGFGVPGAITATDATRTGQPRRVGRIVADNSGNPAKQWRVEITRITGNSTSSNTFDKSFWSALKSVKFTTPVPLLGKVAWVEGEIKAGQELNGTLDALNCIATSYVREIDESGFTGAWETATGASHPNWVASRNNAELFAHVATHPYCLPKKIADGRLDFGGLAEWRDDAAQTWTHGKPRFRFDRVYENGSTLARVLDEVAATGRARRGMPGGKHGVIRDVPQSQVKQHYTPRNSSGYRIEIPFRRRLHAIRARYNKDGLGQEAEIAIYDDGYSADGSVPGTVAATEFETADAIGMVDEELVWALFRYHLAVQRLRPHSHEWSTGVENLKSGRGALVRLTHDVPGFGLGHGRTKSAATNIDGDFTQVTLDSSVTMEPGKSYGIRLRTHAGSFYTTVVNPATSSPVSTTTLTFSVAQPDTWALNALIDAETGEVEQDIWSFGEADKESAEMLIIGVVPGPNLSAKLLAADAAPGVHTADTGAIPEFDPQITLPPPDARKPERPVIRSIKSDESVLVLRVGGVLAVRFLAEFNPPQGLPVPAFIQARWRRTAASPWTYGNAQPAAALSYSGEGVAQGAIYRIEFRYVAQAGNASDWAGQDHTIVGKTTLPTDVADVFDEGEHVRWSYPDAPLDVTHGGGFRAKYLFGNAVGVPGAWDAANAAHGDLISGTAFPKSLLPPGELTVLVKAVDADGNESAAAAELFTEVLAPALANVVETTDFRAAGWPGTIENGSISAGDIIADSASLFWDTGSGPFWSANEAALFWEATWAPVAYEAVYAPPADALPARLTLAIAASGTPQRHLYRIDDREFWGLFGDGAGGGTFWGADEDLFWAPDAAPAWRDWPGYLDLPLAGLAGETPIELRIEAGGGPSEGAITALTATLDAEDLDELLLDVAVAPGGTALPVTETFRRFLHVADLALLDDGGSARGVRIKSALPSDTAPVVECLDAAGSSTAGHVNARPQGY